MKRTTYIAIYNLIDDTARYHREKEQDFLRALDEYEEGDEDLGFLIGKIKKHRAAAKEYEELLESFEQEVEEPSK